MADDQEVTLETLLRAFWTQKLLMAVMTIVGFFIAVIYLNFATYEYTASVQVVPAQNDTSRLSGGGGNAAAGLASLVGVSLAGGQNASAFDIYKENLKAYRTAESLSRDQALMHRVFNTRWDAPNDRWMSTKGGVGLLADRVKSILGLPVYPLEPPSAEDLQKVIQAKLQIDEDERRSIVTLSYRDEDPQLAATILSRLHEASDLMLRERMLLQSNDYIRYIQAQLRLANIAEYRVSLTSLLSEQGKIQMIARSTLPFAATPLGQIAVSSRPTNPKPIIVLVAGLAAGFITGAMVALFLSGILRRSTRAV